MLVRVAPGGVGRLVKVALDEVPDVKRAEVASRMRAFQWRTALQPDYGYTPSMQLRLRCLADAVAIERAVILPSGRAYRLPEKNVRDVLGDEVVDMWSESGRSR